MGGVDYVSLFSEVLTRPLKLVHVVPALKPNIGEGSKPLSISKYENAFMNYHLMKLENAPTLYGNSHEWTTRNPTLLSTLLSTLCDFYQGQIHR